MLHEDLHKYWKRFFSILQGKFIFANSVRNRQEGYEYLKIQPNQHVSRQAIIHAIVHKFFQVVLMSLWKNRVDV